MTCLRSCRLAAGLVFLFLAFTTAAQGRFIETLTTNSWTTGTYRYDGSGNIRTIGGDAYVYDSASRVLSGTAATRRQDYSYDPFGNLLTITTDGNPQTQIRFHVDQNTNRASVPATESQQFNAYGSYDAAGNMLSFGTATFAYDGLGMVVDSTIEGQRTLYLYTPGDERVASIALVRNGASQWIEDRSEWTLRGADQNVLRRFARNSSGTWTWDEDYIYRQGLLLAAEVNRPEKTLRFHVDRLGTPRLITGNGGAEVSRHAYFPFGYEATASPSTERLKFTGHERDRANLDYMHARYYNAAWGRFLSVDPGLDIEEALHEPQVWNRYAYVTNNPLKFTDEDGRYRTFYKEKSLREADAASAPPVIKAALMIQGGLLLGVPAAEGGLAALGTFTKTAFTAFPRLFIAMMGVGVGMTGAPSGPAVNLGSGARPIAGAVNVDSMSPGFQGTMRQIQVAGDALALPFKSGSVGNVTAQNLPGQLLGQGGQKLAGELARTMQSGSTLTVTTRTPGALQDFAKLLEKTYKNVVVKDNMLTAVRR